MGDVYRALSESRRCEQLDRQHAVSAEASHSTVKRRESSNGRTATSLRKIIAPRVPAVSDAIQRIPDHRRRDAEIDSRRSLIRVNCYEHSSRVTTFGRFMGNKNKTI